MITLSELQLKEVVELQTGKRLGHIVDLEIEVDTGIITNIIILDQQTKASFFQKPEEIIIGWGQIETIGADIILITEESSQQISTNTAKKE